ncbi:hypothetical protein RJ55_07326 [Drechmeria coniospora]|nr:hypothetical protein RJ55_07326 [Drechmeria coniospora]
MTGDACPLALPFRGVCCDLAVPSFGGRDVDLVAPLEASRPSVCMSSVWPKTPLLWDARDDDDDDDESRHQPPLAAPTAELESESSRGVTSRAPDATGKKRPASTRDPQSFRHRGGCVCRRRPHPFVLEPEIKKEKKRIPSVSFLPLVGPAVGMGECRKAQWLRLPPI